MDLSEAEKGVNILGIVAERCYIAFEPCLCKRVFRFFNFKSLEFADMEGGFAGPFILNGPSAIPIMGSPQEMDLVTAIGKKKECSWSK